MKTPMKACGTALAVVALGFALAGCGSDTKSATTSSACVDQCVELQQEQQDERVEVVQAGGTSRRKRDHRRLHQGEAASHETAVKRGDPGTPDVNLPVPAGWEDVSAQVPRGFWGGIKFSRSGHGERPADDPRGDVEADRTRRRGEDPRVRTR